ncbi:MAG: hypothetical protein WD249_01415 [Gaiellaceae bacterium]
MKTKAPPHNFTFVLGDEELLTAERIEEILETCDDALVGARDHQAIVEFDRPARSYADAVIQALRQLESVPGVRVLRVEPHELVGLSAIAARVGRSVESIRLLAEGRRGPGGFPTPAARVDAKTRLWDWSEVARWWCDHMDPDRARPLAEGADFLASLNDALDLRARAARLSDTEREAVSAIVGEAAQTRPFRTS